MAAIRLLLLWTAVLALPSIAVPAPHVDEVTGDEIVPVRGNFSYTAASYTDASHTDASHTDASHTDASHTDASHSDASHTDAPLAAAPAQLKTTTISEHTVCETTSSSSSSSSSSRTRSNRISHKVVDHSADHANNGKPTFIDTNNVADRKTSHRNNDTFPTIDAFTTQQISSLVHTTQPTPLVPAFPTHHPVFNFTVPPHSTQTWSQPTKTPSSQEDITMSTSSSSSELAPITSTFRPSCTSLADDEPFTFWSVIYTETITWHGHYLDYIPPYPELELPVYCPDDDDVFPVRPAPTDDTEHEVAFPPWPTDGRHDPEEEWGWDGQHDPGGDEDEGGFDAGNGKGKQKPRPRPSKTLITQDRNPSVVIPWTEPPSFSQFWPEGSGEGRHRFHSSALTGDFLHAVPSFVIIADQDRVIINTETFQNTKPEGSRTVTVDDGTFTIGPTAIIGHGETIKKPTPAPTGAVVTQAPAEHMVVAGGDALTVLGASIVVLHSTTYTYGLGASEKTITEDDDTIEIGPSGISVNGREIGVATVAAGSTKYEIVGGATITEVNPSVIVIKDETYTLSPQMDTTTTVVGGEILTIGPDGVTHSSIVLPMLQVAVTTTFVPSGSWANGFPAKTAGSLSIEDKDEDEDEDEDDADDGKIGNGRSSGSGIGSGDDDDDVGVNVRPEFAFLILAGGIAIGVWELL